MLLAREMPVNAVARYIGVTDKRIWRIVTHYVLKAMCKLDLSRLCGIVIDRPNGAMWIGVSGLRAR